MTYHSPHLFRGMTIDELLAHWQEQQRHIDDAEDHDAVLTADSFRALQDDVVDEIERQLEDSDEQ